MSKRGKRQEALKESELHNVRKKEKPRQRSDSWSTCTRSYYGYGRCWGVARHRGGGTEKQVCELIRRNKERCGAKRRWGGVQDTTYAISVCLCVCGVPALGVCWERAAPAVGCRVGGGSGNGCGIGYVRRVLHEVITWAHDKNIQEMREGMVYVTTSSTQGTTN